MDYSYLDRNIEKIKERISSAAQKCARDASNITFMAAIKSADVEEVNYIYESLGVTDVGENRVQQLLERYDKLGGNAGRPRMHFIGSLQTNKVKYIIDKVCLIHSLDSERLADEINKQAKKKNIIANVLLEINSGSEESKGGVDPADAADFCLSLAKYENIKLCGFMTMAPKCEKNDEYRKYFQETSRQALDIWQKNLHNIGRPILSMGMSDSFEVAIEEGADIVRVGRALFAPRNH